MHGLYHSMYNPAIFYTFFAHHLTFASSISNLAFKPFISSCCSCIIFSCSIILYHNIWLNRTLSPNNSSYRIPYVYSPGISSYSILVWISFTVLLTICLVPSSLVTSSSASFSTSSSISIALVFGDLINAAWSLMPSFLSSSSKSCDTIPWCGLLLSASIRVYITGFSPKINLTPVWMMIHLLN